jgi:protein ImuB
MTSRVAAIHLPSFGLQALVRRRPALASQPLALEGEGPLRGRVAEASRRARADGVAEGQTLTQARAACPDLLVLPRDEGAEGALQDARRAVHEALLLVSPRVEWSGGGSFCIEATGLSALMGSERALLARAVEVLDDAGFVARAACASTRLAASIAARHRAGACIVPAGGEGAFLAPLPLSSLPLGPETLRRFHLLGIRTLGQFAKLPAEGLADRFGREVARWQRRARGEDPAPLPALRETKLPRVARELDDPIEGLQAVTFLLKSAVEDLCDELSQRGILAARLELAFELDGAPPDSRVLEPSRPLGSPRALLSLCRLELEERRVAAPLLGLALGVLEERPARGLSDEMFGESLDPEALGAALDRVRALVGPQDVVAPAPRASHRREARVGWEPFRLEPAREPARAKPEAAPDALTLLEEPCPGERLLEEPAPVLVRMPSEDRPGALHATACARAALGLPERIEIVQARGPRRLCGEWWDGGADVDRDEWLLIGSDGGAYRAVRDRRTREWSLLGVVD